MYREKRIALVIPAYNEAKLIKPTLKGVPAVIDRVYVVDDVSPDNQNEVIRECAQADPRITLLQHDVNQGPGGAIITGYLQAFRDEYDIMVVVGGDNQMPLDEVAHFLDPIIDGKADYTKGNRFLLSQLDDTLAKMPTIRLIGNWMITMLTKIASGYYKIMDFVDGYTAISREAVGLINWDLAWKKYGYPMDFLIRMNAYSLRVMDIPRTAIYLPGERQSQIKGFRYFLSVTPMLLRGFLWRLKFKYVYRDFHPLVLFYLFGGICLLAGLIGGGYLILDKLWLTGGFGVTASRSVLVALLILSGVQFILFAMFFDMEESKEMR
ncbi:glycosyltransferase [candidate division KSB3 bacterium]|uniref:Glycosyltransferase n=1 Tax=candidate division KSB3 bacterium TaxID=2044937 RepID=A0A9D5JYM9_9BACT|nr:glycosyltransferase [candidate division KSB3 bacterium]MBD3326156.1 glycosyltransferase [candidate division KSB3 bacterium]